MRKKLPFYQLWLFSLALVFGTSTAVTAQSTFKTLTQLRAEQALNSSRSISQQPKNNLISNNSSAVTTADRVTLQGCDQGDDSNSFENGFNITAESGYRSADDFYVSENENLNVRSIVFNVFANYPVSSVDFNFYEDDGGKPGATVVASENGLIPYAQVPIGASFGYTVYAIYVEVDFNFDGGASGTSYWMQPEVDSPMAFWEGTSAGTLGEVIHMSEFLGPWLPDDDGGIHHGVFKLHCDVVVAVDPICFDISDTIEPITRVVLSDIDNTSSAAIDGSPALEDFTNIEGVMVQGISYDIALEGNTNGFLCYFTVWIDWNQNGEFEADEMYEIGYIDNSTGTDGQQTTGTITVPTDAVLGETTMRVIKNWDTSPTDPCDVYLYGQGEDYTIIVEDELGVESQTATAFSYYPNPTSSVVKITTNKEINSVSVVNILGQQVLVKENLENGLVDLSNLQTGTYIFRVAFEDGSIENFKILKE
ncbi:GEVED domain-containing protein [Aequorivita sinensis]|uniref:GEVED domain-containing protein n=1 Tax=Aequorivita sinensis TaxID=1382458 RepID=UPI001121565E|nr:GEVED domain-containing protein [Aequorivita sinensis]